MGGGGFGPDLVRTTNQYAETNNSGELQKSQNLEEEEIRINTN